ncbi:prepilin-type N-terminal cleavage/methylation domain-containing protein [bacterium]|nr:prepilin-type N-terminal cleavage/methylation domain-containing protein [bacterium]
MRQGFTLLETIFASVLFGFIVLFVLNLYPSSIVAVRRGETQIIADNCAQAILEDLRSRSFYNVNVASPPTYQKWVYGGTDFIPTVSLAYDTDSSLEPFLKIATVNITWTFQNRTNSVVHTMYLNNITR